MKVPDRKLRKVAAPSGRAARGRGEARGVSPPEGGREGPPKNAYSVAFTTGQVARYCFVTSDTIVNWIHAGALPAQRTPGGQHRILFSDLLAFQREHGMSTELLEAELNVRPHCWEFHCTGETAEGCRGCLVHRSGALRCWELSAHVERKSAQRSTCQGCEYYERYVTSTDEETD